MMPLRDLSRKNRYRIGTLLLILAAPCLPLAQAAVTYPVDGDGSYRVNVVRHTTAKGVLSSTITQTGLVYASGGVPSAIIDGSLAKSQWDVDHDNRSNSTATVRLTLARSYSINKITTLWPIRALYQTIRFSDTGFGSMTNVSVSNAVDYTTTITFAPTTAKYIELIWYGAYEWTPTTAYVALREIQVYPHAATTGTLPADEGLNVIPAITPVMTNVSTGNGAWADNLYNCVDGDINSYTRGINNPYVPGTRSNAIFVLDMGVWFQAVSIWMCYYEDQTWGVGGKVEISPDGSVYTTVLDQATALGQVKGIAFEPLEKTRYVRVTDYESHGGAIVEFEVHAVPPPRGTVIMLR